MDMINKTFREPLLFYTYAH